MKTNPLVRIVFVLAAGSAGAESLRQQSPCDRTLKEILMPLGRKIQQESASEGATATQKAANQIAEAHYKCRQAEGRIRDAETKGDDSAKSAATSDARGAVDSMHSLARSVLGERSSEQPES